MNWTIAGCLLVGLVMVNQSLQIYETYKNKDIRATIIERNKAEADYYRAAAKEYAWVNNVKPKKESSNEQH